MSIDWIGRCSRPRTATSPSRRRGLAGPRRRAGPRHGIRGAPRPPRRTSGSPAQASLRPGRNADDPGCRSDRPSYLRRPGRPRGRASPDAAARSPVSADGNRVYAGTRSGRHLVLRRRRRSLAAARLLRHDARPRPASSARPTRSPSAALGVRFGDAADGIAGRRLRRHRRAAVRALLSPAHAMQGVGIRRRHRPGAEGPRRAGRPPTRGRWRRPTSPARRSCASSSTSRPIWSLR